MRQLSLYFSCWRSHWTSCWRKRWISCVVKLDSLRMASGIAWPCCLFFWVVAAAGRDIRESRCPNEATDCHFTLVVDYGLTMMAGKILVKAKDGRIYRYDDQDMLPHSALNLEEVITADGHPEPRLVMTYNGTIPGPALHVRRGQKVHLTIHNQLMHETTSLHVHGQYQRGTTHSDGVPFISHSPILPGQTVIQSFMADPEGTFFYHSHSGPQMTNGLYGPFIVHPSLQNQTKIDNNNVHFASDPGQNDVIARDVTADDEEPPEHILMFQDWNHDWDSNMVTLKMRYGLYTGGHKLNITHNLAGAAYSAFEFHSGLINGRGRFYNESGQHNGAPLSEFWVHTGRRYRFRLINAGDIHPFRVWIEGHSLLVVASDGHAIQPVQVESVIIAPGERYDVIVDADQPLGSYWIRGQTLQVERNNTAEAILRYVGAPENEKPLSRQRECTKNNPCVVLNCPFELFPLGSNTHCFNYDRIRSKEVHLLQKSKGKKFREFFLNFAFPGLKDTPGSVNGRSFVFSHFVQGTMGPTLTCSRDSCADDQVCHCPYIVSFDQGDLIQFVFLNMGSGQGWDHPIHMHGHSFQVVKVGFPTYNQTTGQFLQASQAIQCLQQFCNQAKWTNTSWAEGNVPGSELAWGALKDVINVPSGGYVVVRIQADNPGLWLLHCHLELHMTDGMSALLNESFSLWPPPSSPGDTPATVLWTEAPAEV